MKQRIHIFGASESRHESAKAFIEWAAGYDSGELTGRSLPRHEKWMEGLDNKIVRIVNHSFDESIDIVINAIKDGFN